MEPAASPSLSCSSHHESHLAQIELFVFLTFPLILCLYLVAILRRRGCRFRTALKVFALLANAAILSLIPYIYGLMRNLAHRSDLVSIWAVFLMYVYVNVPNFVSFNYPPSIVMAYVKLSLYGYYITLIIYTSPPRISEYWKHPIPPSGMPRLYTALEALVTFRALEIMVSRALLTYDEKHIWLRYKRLLEDEDDQPDNISTTSSSSNEDHCLRCNYVVYQTDPNKRITVQEIWGIQEPAGCVLLSSSPELKSYCFSLSLLWKLVPVFNGHRSYPSSSDQEEAWNVVRRELLDCGDTSQPFRVIEVELTLLYDYINNTSCFILYKFGFPMIYALHLVRLVGIICVGALSLELSYNQKGTTVGIREVLLTWIVVIASTLLELAQFIVFLGSRWHKMQLLCTYLIRKSWVKKNVLDRFIRKATETILRPMHFCGGGGVSEIFKLRQTQLRQYSLLDAYSYLQNDCLRSVLVSTTLIHHLTGNRFVRQGKKESKSVSLTNEIKVAVINKLLARGRHLTNGIATLEAASNPLSAETKSNLVWACTQVHTKAQVVLLWHIATSLCEIDELRCKRLPLDDDAFNVATTLSKYCAYLVAFAPDMLPGNVANTTYTCNTVIDEAYDCLEGCKGPILFDKIMEIANKYDDPNSHREVASVLGQGAIIGKVLVTQVDDPRARWDVLAGFWAEMILYLAPNGYNEWAHVERLADGGEFITQLWALLFHAGVVDRDSLSNKAASATARDPEAGLPAELDQV